MNIAKRVPVQNIKVAWIYLAVGLDYKLVAAYAAHAAGFGRVPQQHFNVVFKLPDMGRAALLNIRVPKVKKFAHEIAEGNGREGEFLYSILLAERRNTGNKLQVPKPLAFIEIVNFTYMPCGL